jgi:hypothetical protein
MKKVLLSLCIAALALPLFADDALVLPSRVIRTYLVGVYANVPNEYDLDSKKQSLDNKISLFNLGAAVEYGVNDWISAAVQWVPGYYVASKIDGVDGATLADAADLFVGAKLQIVGPKAPVQNDTIRFAFAPGVKIPLSKPDYEKEFESYMKGDDYLAKSADKHLFAFGGRGYFDYVINEMFFLNLYSEFLYYPGSIKAEDASVTDYGTVLGSRAYDPNYDPSLKYGYDLTLEFEPHFNTMVSEGLEFGAGLPFTYTASPGVSVSDDSLDVYSNEAQPVYAETQSSHLLNLGPYVSLFFQKSFIPLEFKVGYTFPLLGKNESAANRLLFELKAYAKL